MILIGDEYFVPFNKFEAAFQRNAELTKKLDELSALAKPALERWDEVHQTNADLTKEAEQLRAQIEAVNREIQLQQTLHGQEIAQKDALHKKDMAKLCDELSEVSALKEEFESEFFRLQESIEERAGSVHSENGNSNSSNGNSKAAQSQSPAKSPSKAEKKAKKQKTDYTAEGNPHIIDELLTWALDKEAVRNYKLSDFDRV